MEQFRHVGEVLGGLKALMILQDDVLINQRQCCLLLDIYTLAFNTIAEEIKNNLKLEEKSTKWKPLEEPLRELYRLLREGELYVRRCLDDKSWWGKAISLHQNKDCVELHIHNLLSHFPAVIEAIEVAGEISGLDQEEMLKKRVMLAKKYDRGWNDMKLFQWRFGKQYLIPQYICTRFETAMKEDRWLITETIKEKKKSVLLSKNEQRLGDLLLKKINGQELINGKLPPSSILLSAEDYQIRRRLGGGSQYKEIQWLGESFAMRHFYGDIQPLSSEISTLLSLSHPNIVQYLCGFYDEDKKECFLVMDLMNKDLYSHSKEICSPRRQALFPLPVIVDMMLQVARGMEYLHSRRIYVGDLNPTNVFLKPRKSAEGYFHVKVSGYGLTSVKDHPSRHSSKNQPAIIEPYMWYAPEVLAEQEQSGGSTSTCKYTEKADVYSFGMLCFQLLTGKLPFEDGHLQSDQMFKNIRAGERPLFPFLSPKYLVNLTKKCWHTNPSYRPSFTSVCRVLRYIKKFLVMNPSDGQPEIQTPPVDYSDLEVGFLKKNPVEASSDATLVSRIPFQMFAYRLAEKEKTSFSIKFKNLETASNGWDESTSVVEDPFVQGCDVRSIGSDGKAAHFDSKSVSNVFTEKKMPLDLRSVQSEPPEKKKLLKIKPIDVKISEEKVQSGFKLNRPEPVLKKIVFVQKPSPVKVKKIATKPKPQKTPAKPLTWQPAGHSVKATWQPAGQSLKAASRGNPQLLTVSSPTLSPSKRRTLTPRGLNHEKS